MAMIRQDIIDLYNERAAIMQYDANYMQHDAERIAWYEALKTAKASGADANEISQARAVILASRGDTFHEKPLAATSDDQ